MASDGASAKNSTLIKFETRSNRVKGLSFHPKRPWILASLHSGAIQLWDYRMGSLIDRFEEHEGPVRSVDFHSNQPLFVSGGDDAKIKIWNYRLRRCIFTLTGHLDYVRTVEFHKRSPWIVSSSDDQTLRIWNWQGRSCISVITGHNHYVMSASFHPARDLVVSSSLDQTLRLWDLTGLKHQSRLSTFAGNVTQDIFGSNDVQSKHILEGHERGVNYASFHPTLPLIVSGADDRTIRIWAVEEIRAYEKEQFRGHMGNVSCVKYFKDYVVSNSEDRSIRVWDVNSRSAIYVSRRDSDRFWVLAVHPEKNLIAAGHDTGMIVFKLERERPAMQVVADTVYWVNPKRQLRSYNFDTKASFTLIKLARSQTYPPHTMSYCKEENMCVFYYAQDGGAFELYPLGKSDRQQVPHEEVKRGYYNSAVFFQRNKFAVLDKGRQIVIKNTQNNILTVLPAVHNTDEIFWAPNGLLLLRGDDKVYLFDPHQKKVTCEATAAKVKYVVWSPESARDGKVALLSKHSISILTKKGLKSVCSLHENSRVKSACFDEKAIVLFYCTMNHLKYCLPNGDTGTIKTLDAPIYLVRVVGDEVYYVTREGEFCNMTVDSAEYRFKLALHGGKWPEVLKILKTARFHGQALVCYLQQRGFPEVAMHFVKDHKIRFRLAVDCGNLEDAYECADNLSDEEAWEKLAGAARSCGKIQLTNTCHNKQGGAQAMQRMSFLNFLTGNHEKARDYSDMQRDDVNHRFQTALFTDDAESRIKLLEEAGQFTLAHQIAVRNGMTDKAGALLKKAAQAVHESMVMPPVDEDEEDEEAEDMQQVRATREMRAKESAFAVCQRLQDSGTEKAIQLPTPSPNAEDWPLYRIEESRVKALLASGQTEDLGGDDGGAAGGWGGGGLDDMDEMDDMDGGGAPKWGGGDDLMDDDDMDMDAADGWGDIGEIKVDAEDLMKGRGDGDIIFPMSGRGILAQWSNSEHPCDLIAAGSFEAGMKRLKAQKGVKEFEPLRPLFYQCYLAATGSVPLPNLLPPRNVYHSTPEKVPVRAITLQNLQEKAKLGTKYFMERKFQESCAAFQSVLQMNVLLVTDEKEQQAREQVIKRSHIYASGTLLQLARQEVTNPSKSAEMACYFTHYDLDPNHMTLVVNQAMIETYKKGFFRTSGVLGRRLLEFNPDAKMQAQAKKAVTTSDIKDDASQLDYDARNPFETCVVAWVPMYMGTVTPIRCSCCGAPAEPSNTGKICPVCNLGEFR
eukprot:TRINITY_DN2462_c1_g1_i1.p1 TRINITY_DN2462_c1_g1~~TRINITY_DN2462_c1_g1_i1.p1  ORF type:complete len:1241 (+),score=601.51 TRINITY_DN2462_c1_g1_i1:82-3804(+)